MNLSTSDLLDIQLPEAVSAALAHDGPSVIEIPVAEHFPLAAKTPGKADH